MPNLSPLEPSGFRDELNKLSQLAAASNDLSRVVAWDIPSREPGPIGTADSGQTWVAEEGSWDINTDGVIRPAVLINGRAILTLDTGIASEMTVEATVRGGSSSGAGIIMAFVDIDNFLYGWWQGSARMRIREVVDGVDSELGVLTILNTGGWVRMQGRNGPSRGSSREVFGAMLDPNRGNAQFERNFIFNDVGKVGLIAGNPDDRFSNIVVKRNI